MGCVQAPGADVQTCCIITLPWPFISTMLQMMKAWTLLQEWTRWAELREREGRGMGCGGGRRRGTDGRQHPQSGSTHTRGEASRTHTHIGFTHTHTHTGFTDVFYISYSTAHPDNSLLLCVYWLTEGSAVLIRQGRRVMRRNTVGS